MKDGEIKEMQSKASSLQAEVNALREQRSQDTQVQRRFHAILSAYRTVRVQLEEATRGTSKIPDTIEHEEQILGRAADQVLHS